MDDEAPQRELGTQPPAWWIAGALAALVLMLVSVAVGPGDVSLPQVLAVVKAKATGSKIDDPLVAALVWDLRLPRVILVGLVGASLATAGAVTQGLFRNPLAEPGVLGVSSGAAAVAVIGFALGLDRAGLWVTPVLAALGAAGILAILMALSTPRHDRAWTSLGTLLLSGVALGALASAVTTVVLSMGVERWDLGLKVVRWLMGSFEGRSWGHLGSAVGPMVLGVGCALWLRLDLDALQLGPDTAASLGFDPRRTQAVALLAVGLLVGTATAVAGVIGFVGLVVPHIVRLWFGPNHRALLPLSVVGGALLLLLVDLATRTVDVLALPPGAITSLLGAPFFLWLLRRGEVVA